MVLDAVTGIVGSRVVATTPGARGRKTNRLLRLEPRRDNDVDRDFTMPATRSWTSCAPSGSARTRRTRFNPATTIEFTIPKASMRRCASTMRRAAWCASSSIATTRPRRSIVRRGDGRDDAGQVGAIRCLLLQARSRRLQRRAQDAPAQVHPEPEPIRRRGGPAAAPVAFRGPRRRSLDAARDLRHHAGSIRTGTVGVTRRRVRHGHPHRSSP
jgi:hypothetical protein